MFHHYNTYLTSKYLDIFLLKFMYLKIINEFEEKLYCVQYSLYI